MFRLCAGRVVRYALVDLEALNRGGIAHLHLGLRERPEAANGCANPQLHFSPRASVDHLKMTGPIVDNTGIGRAITIGNEYDCK